MNLKIVTTFRVQVASKEDCDTYKKPYGSLEALDANGHRVTWANNKEHMIEQCLMLVGGLDDETTAYYEEETW